MNEARTLQMEMEKPDAPIDLDTRSPRFKNDLNNTFEHLRKNQYELVLVVISGMHKQIYGMSSSSFSEKVTFFAWSCCEFLLSMILIICITGQVKQIAELQVGILTQCIKDITIIRRNNQSTVHNVLLKVNAKFNGTNQVIDPNQK